MTYQNGLICFLEEKYAWINWFGSCDIRTFNLNTR